MRIIWGKKYYWQHFWREKKNHCSKKREEKDICQIKMCGFIVSFWRIRTLIYSCRVTSKAQLVSSNSVPQCSNRSPRRKRRPPAAGAFPRPANPRCPRSWLNARLRQCGAPESLRCICCISERHRQRVIISFCAPKYTVTFVTVYLGGHKVTQFIWNTGDRKCSIQASHILSVLCHGGARWTGRKHRRDRTFDITGDHTIRN